MKQEPSYFEGKDAELVYIAKSLNDALRLERAFEAAGVDFGVEADEYRGGVIFAKVRVGAFFYVLKDDAETARAMMSREGFKANAVSAAQSGPPSEPAA